MAKRAYGRSLSDFPDLSEAEKHLIACTARGEDCILGDGKLPLEASAERNIRAELVRFLALGGDDVTPVHEHGLNLIGAWIEETLDCRGAFLSFRLWLIRCAFCKPIILVGAKSTSISLDGSKFFGIRADGLNLSRSLILTEVKSIGEISLVGSNIGGDLSCTKGSFENKGRSALICDRAFIAGNVRLNEDFKSIGEVRFFGSKISGNFYCNSATFHNADGVALGCQAIIVKGSFRLKKLDIVGQINFDRAEIGTLIDDQVSWPDMQCILGSLKYSGIHIKSPIDSKTRIAWLKKQRPDFLNNKNFDIQPWTQLAKVFRQMGHAKDADDVLIEREKLLRQAGRFASPRLHWLYGALANYGYSPFKPLRYAFGVWLFCALFYASAAQNNLIGPSNPLVFLNADLKAKCEKANWVTCDLPPNYTSFSPFIYSLDLILPVVDLSQAKDWTPLTASPTDSYKYGDWRDLYSKNYDWRNSFSAVYHEVKSWFTLDAGLWLRFLTYFEQLAGWVLGLTLAGALTGLFSRRDKE